MERSGGIREMAYRPSLVGTGTGSDDDAPKETQPPKEKKRVSVVLPATGEIVLPFALRKSAPPAQRRSSPALLVEDDDDDDEEIRTRDTPRAAAKRVTLAGSITGAGPASSFHQRGEGGDEAVLDSPEVQMLLQTLNERVSTLESLLKEGCSSGDDSAPMTVTITPEQRRAMSGLSSNVKGLLHCVQHRIEERESKVLLTLDGNDDEGICGHSSWSSSPDHPHSARPRVRRSAETESKKHLLDDLLGPEEAPPPQSAEALRRDSSRATVYSTNKGMRSLRAPSVNSMGEDIAPIPEELIRGVLEADDVVMPLDESNSSRMRGRWSRRTNVLTASFLAHVYGGMDLPKMFTVTEGKARKKSMRVFARAVADANAFVSHIKLEGHIGKNDLTYLPMEFTRLEKQQRLKLAKMLSWENLKAWGFDAFEVDRLSTVTLFRRSASGRRSAFYGENNTYGVSQSSILDGLNSSEHSIEDDADDPHAVESSRRGCPLVLIGWALLASPYSQLAMAKNVNDEEMEESAWKSIRQRAKTSNGAMARKMLEENSDKADGEIGDEPAEDDAWNGGYFLQDSFEVSPRVIARFLRKVEGEYSPRKVNPYHNNIHAADVVQSTHALVQMGGEDMELAYTPLETYSLLLAAACHDIKHPGTSNNYQVNKRTEYALRYNDHSVLENMHASRAACLLEGVDINESGEASGNGGGEQGILGKMTKEQRTAFRTSLLRSILSTDMSRHFREIAKMKGHVETMEEEIELELESSSPLPRTSFLSRIGGEKHKTFREKFLPFLLHLADISNPAKPHDVSSEWIKCVYDEFFLQGEREAAEDLPVSPLCDRKTTSIPESQLGFMTYVVGPAFEILGRCLPKVESIVLSEFNKNLEYWKGEQAKLRSSEDKVKVDQK